MTLARVLEETRRTLEANGIEEAAVEADLFLMKALGVDRAGLYASPERTLSTEERQTLARDMARRLNGEPWPYISGHREFYGLDFRVGPRVFIPRPETELLVDLALEAAHALPADRTILIADACTGSGAIAIALAVHLPNARFYATDMSTLTLDVAQRNCEDHGVEDRVTILDGDLLRGVPSGLDIVVSNPPYVPRTELPYLAREVRTETLVSLDGGDGGLEIIRALVPQALGRLRRPGTFIMELSPEQGDAVREMCLAIAPDADVTLHNDLAGLTRAIRAMLP
ncbi:MAG: peptide chain release factor N(5)-glutamine methyltransferase [Chloroflexota bacterium]|nr:peptide chain release factor N(5)-glutamine methyltransferase [Chloroflexota bacterium]MDE2942217.1 peptide chain release factor N(5)-glutamine methyltransferase [Chloroflexota bacterium]MDE3267685.1 peptide chain release factor N(5)-glutamine methyltransferase [Chloroflexota bacterium]